MVKNNLSWLQSHVNYKLFLEEEDESPERIRRVKNNIDKFTNSYNAEITKILSMQDVNDERKTICDLAMCVRKFLVKTTDDLDAFIAEILEMMALKRVSQNEAATQSFDEIPSSQKRLRESVENKDNDTEESSIHASEKCEATDNNADKNEETETSPYEARY